MAVIRKYIDTVALDYYHRYWVNPKVRHLQNVANVTVTFVAQTLTDEQKTQARLNIGAADAASVVTLADAQTITGAKTFRGAVIVPTVGATDDSQNAATTAWVRALVGSIADLEQETF